MVVYNKTLLFISLSVFYITQLRQFQFQVQYTWNAYKIPGTSNLFLSETTFKSYRSDHSKQFRCSLCTTRRWLSMGWLHC